MNAPDLQLPPPVSEMAQTAPGIGKSIMDAAQGLGDWLVHDVLGPAVGFVAGKVVDAGAALGVVATGSVAALSAGVASSYDPHHMAPDNSPERAQGQERDDPNKSLLREVGSDNAQSASANLPEHLKAAVQERGNIGIASAEVSPHDLGHFSPTALSDGKGRSTGDLGIA